MTPSEQVRELATIDPDATTDELLHKLLANLTALLGARRAYITELIAKGKSRTIASWESGCRGPVREYEMQGTPCEAVMRNGVQVIDCGLSDRYLFDETSLGYGCESFIGNPIVDHHGKRIGQLCVFGAQPLDNSEMAGALLSLAAVRVSAELEPRQHEASLRHQRRALEVLLGNLPGMVYRCDFDESRRLQFASQGCEALTGYDDRRLVDEVGQWTRLVDEADRQRIWQEIQTAVSAGGAYEIQYQIRTRDGSRKWIWERGCVLRDNEGQVRAIEGFVSDATALRESEAALARSCLLYTSDAADESSSV